MISTDVMLLFDLDGTLWDSAKNVAISWNEVLRKEAPKELEVDEEFVHSVMGMTMKEIADHTITKMDEENKRKVFKHCEEYEVEYLEDKGGELFEGVEETLKKLSQLGYKMAVVSNCQTGYINAFMTSMNMKQYFVDYEEWGRTLKSKAENIRLVMNRNGFDKGIYIGDTQKDMDAARGAKIPFIHASYGFGQVNNPDAIITKFSEMLNIVETFQLK